MQQFITPSILLIQHAQLTYFYLLLINMQAVITPLCATVEAGHEQLVYLLLDHHAGINFKDEVNSCLASSIHPKGMLPQF